jgi:hypothetical protein
MRQPQWQVRTPPQVTTSAAGTAGGHQAGPEVMSEDEGVSHGTDCTGSEGPPLASRVVQPTSPRLVEAAALEPQGRLPHSRQEESHRS